MKSLIFLKSALLVLIFLAQGCSFQHSAAVNSDKMVRVYPEEGHKPIALLHTETWSLTLFCQNIGGASLADSQRELVHRAKMLGADAVVYPKNHVETRMPFPLPFIIGWEEYHVWGMAVKK